MSGDEATDAAFNLLAALIDVGAGLGEMCSPDDLSVDSDYTPPAEEIAALLADKCPSKARLQAFAESDAFLSLEEYLEMMDGPISVEAESEAVWPYQPVVDYDAIAD